MHGSALGSWRGGLLKRTAASRHPSPREHQNPCATTHVRGPGPGVDALGLAGELGEFDDDPVEAWCEEEQHSRPAPALAPCPGLAPSLFLAGGVWEWRVGVAVVFVCGVVCWVERDPRLPASMTICSMRRGLQHTAAQPQALGHKARLPSRSCTRGTGCLWVRFRARNCKIAMKTSSLLLRHVLLACLLISFQAAHTHTLCERIPRSHAYN